ncbi:hypothetical protein HOY80DRAFT_1140407 [Tuber brumale]|nr:hypothetical protein HOY80DRAFT_1140407 [Tuber brumale]
MSRISIWLTDSTLLEEEVRLSEQVSEAERKVKKFEKHLEDLMQNIGEAGRLIGCSEEDLKRDCELDEQELGDIFGEEAGVPGTPAPREESVGRSLDFSFEPPDR